MKNRKLYIVLILLLTNLSLFANSYTIKGYVYIKADNNPITNYPVKVYTDLTDTSVNYTVYTRENGYFFYTWSESVSDQIIVKINNYKNEIYSPILDTINILELQQTFEYYITPNFLRKYIVKGKVLNSTDQTPLQDIDVFICSEGTNGMCHDIITNDRGFYLDSIFSYNHNTPSVYVSVFDNCTNSIIKIKEIEFYNYISENNFEICPPSENITLDYYYQRYPKKNVVYFCGITNTSYDSLQWDFGDGSTYDKIECIHEFYEEGVYEVKLKIFVNSQQIEKTKYVSVGDIVKLKGEVYTATNKLPYGYALAFQKDETGIKYIDKTEIIDGAFEFSEIYKSEYFIYIVPKFDLDTNYFPKYLATYYSDQTEWQNAEVINLAKQNEISLNLKYYPEIVYGPNQINVKVDNSLFKLSDIIVALLINSNGEVIESQLTSKNRCMIKFRKLPKDIYTIKIEIAGKISPIARVNLIENKNQNVNFYMTSHDMIFYTTNIEEIDLKANKSIKIFPNPCSNLLYFSGEIENKEIMVYSSDGKLIKNTKINNGNIDISDLPSGNYFMNIISVDGKIIEQKVFIKN